MRLGNDTNAKESWGVAKAMANQFLALEGKDVGVVDAGACWAASPKIYPLLACLVECFDEIGCMSFKFFLPSELPSGNLIGSKNKRPVHGAGVDLI